MNTRMGWCRDCTPDKRSHYCANLCRRSFTTQYGVTWTCDCPHHQTEEN